MAVFPILIESRSDWTTVEILNDARWHSPAGDAVSLNAADGSVRNLTINDKYVRIAKNPQDSTYVTLGLFVQTDQKILRVRVCKGDIEYTRVQSDNGSYTNDVDIPGDPYNCRDGEIKLTPDA